MKKVLFSILAVAAVVACNKNDVTPSQPAGEPGAIKFGVSGLVATKAVSESDANTVQASGFNVAGIVDETTVYFNELASVDAVNSNYATATQYYYPTGKTLDFYAVHPVNRTIAVAADGVVTVAYEQTNTEDLIVAKREAVAASAGDVALTFDHVLSQLVFTVKGADAKADYLLKSINVTAPNGGTYKFADGQWTRGEDAVEAYWATDLEVSTSEPTAVDESMTFLPGAVVIEATWETYVNDELIASYTKATAADAIELEMGKKNTINLTLPNADAQGITFTVTVNPWGTASQDVTLN